MGLRGDRGMSDYQVTNYGMCGECKWHEKSLDWFCCCEDSEYFTCYTEYTDTCECFEQRGVE